MEKCIFCMVARGELDARIIFENDLVVAFDDIAPQAPVHTLVIPREHYGSLSDGVPQEVYGAVFAAVAEVAALKGVTDSGYRVIVNNGEDANQTVGHLHVHILGGRRMSHGMVNFDGE